MNTNRIWLSPPHMGGKEFEYVKEAFDTNWIAPIGPHVDGFETDLQTQLGVPCAVLSSGTAAIHLALILAGVKPGDEVLCQSLTFCGSSHPILYQGATPVFIDSEADTWNMDPALLRQAVKDRIKHGRKPKAIIYVHLYGMPAKVDEIRQIASEFEIFLIEDAAEALGSTYKGEQAGRFGNISTLSFNGNKIITSSGGGALASSNDQWVKKAKFLATQARDAAPHYEHSEVGFNYRMSNVCAAIGRGQLTVLQERVDKRRKNFDQYRDALGAMGGISFLEEPEGTKSNRWLTTILVDPKVTKGVTHDALRLALDKENIESRPLWKPMHLQPVYSGAKSYLSGVSERLFSQGLCLPSGSSLSQSEQERVIAIVSDVLQRS